MYYYDQYYQEEIGIEMLNNNRNTQKAKIEQRGFLDQINKSSPTSYSYSVTEWGGWLKVSNGNNQYIFLKPYLAKEFKKVLDSYLDDLEKVGYNFKDEDLEKVGYDFKHEN